MNTQRAESPWHEGERQLQASVGAEARMAQFGPRVIRDHMPDQHRAFYAQLPFLVVGSVDPAGAPWATLFTGEPGFLNSPDPRSLVAAVASDATDPAWQGLEAGAAVGLLGIEPHTRRCNRMNGRVGERGAGGLTIEVEHSFGNCPQYIQSRQARFLPAAVTAEQNAVQHGTELDAEARATIADADTLFVASYVDADQATQTGRQVDVSHRGGKPGFVRVAVDGTLTVPDFAGNLHFNTLGNLLLNPRAGLLFVDFESGDLLQLTGTARVILDSPDLEAFQGAERLWTFTPERWVRRRSAARLRFSVGQQSPNNALTGSWTEAAARLAARERAGAWRPFEIVETRTESASVCSFYLEPRDGHGVLPFQAGEHLPVRVQLPGELVARQRSYSLSAAPAAGRYRISIKRDGAVSRYLHAEGRAGLHIQAGAPAGAFTLDAAAPRPAVLLAAGIGITPLLSMLHHVVYEGARTRTLRPTWLYYASRTVADRAFDAELDALVAAAAGQLRVIRVVSQPEPGRVVGVDFDVVGRIDSSLLGQTLPFDDYDFYLCGPGAFSQALYDQLRDKRVPDDWIHAESFGPASLKRRSAARLVAPALPKPATEPVPVRFVGSAREATWQPAAGTLLDLAEAEGLEPAWSCRGGSCGTCRVKVEQGAVTYETPPTAAVDADEALLCCAVPAAGRGDSLTLAL
ncbi:MAG: pyridoxamine 5'-phosphate oxidase family protein [Pseudomonadota bacterium]